MLLAYFVVMSTAYAQWTEKELKKTYKIKKEFYKQYIKDGYKVDGDYTIEELVSKDMSITKSEKYCYPFKDVITGGSLKSFDDLEESLRKRNARQIAKEIIDMDRIRAEAVSMDSTMSLFFSSAEQTMCENLEKELERPIFLYKQGVDILGQEWYAGYGLFVVDAEKAKEIRKNAVLDAARKFGIPISE